MTPSPNPQPWPGPCNYPFDFTGINKVVATLAVTASNLVDIGYVKGSTAAFTVTTEADRVAYSAPDTDPYFKATKTCCGSPYPVIGGQSIGPTPSNFVTSCADRTGGATKIITCPLQLQLDIQGPGDGSSYRYNFNCKFYPSLASGVPRSGACTSVGTGFALSIPLVDDWSLGINDPADLIGVHVITGTDTHGRSYTFTVTISA